jgi:hypothetical protein
VVVALLVARGRHLLTGDSYGLVMRVAAVLLLAAGGALVWQSTAALLTGTG